MARSRLTTREQLRSMWELGGLTPWQLTKRVWFEIGDDNLLGRAAELAYSFVLAIFPLLLLLLALFGLFASRGTELQNNLLSYFARVLPPDAFDLVTRTIAEVSQNAGGVKKLTIGILFTLWAASGGATSMISALNGAYHVRERRSWLKVHGIAVALTGTISVLVLAALVVVLLGGQIADFVGAKLNLESSVVIAWKVLQPILALAFVSVSFSLIYYYGPDLKERHWYWITPGSIFGVLLWLGASYGFRAYLHFFNSYSKTYGSLGAAMILLVWLYVAGLAFLIGGEINAEIEHAAAQHGHPEAKPEGKKAA